MKEVFKHLQQNWIKYGFESVAVLVSILAAFALNNWNEDRKAEIQERILLTRMHEDLDRAMIQSEEYILLESKYLSNLEDILGPKKVVDSILAHPSRDSILNRTLWAASMELPVIHTYNDLKNAGKVGLIGSLEIRDRLTRLEYTIYDLSTLLRDRLTVHQTRIDDIVSDYINFMPLVKAQGKPFDIYVGEISDYKLVLNQKRVRNLLGIKMVLTDDILDNRIDLHKELVELNELIKKELGLE